MAISWVLAIAAVWLAAAMAGAWALQRATRNAGWVDAVWSAATGLGGAAAALVPSPGGDGMHTRQFLAALMAAVWGGRLAWHIYLRTRGGGPEDVRYATFRREWGTDFETRLFGFLMIQAAASWVLVLTVCVAARNPAPGLGLTDFLAVALLAASVAGEGQADAQLQRFRQAGSGGICDVGLWGWSRHPNYFFEFLGWCAYPLLASSGGGLRWLIALAGPAMMFWLLRYVSGVPPLESAMLARRGDAFRAYQSRVSVFFHGRRSAADPERRMNLESLATGAAERVDLPDALLRAGIARMVAGTARTLAPQLNADTDFAAWMATQPVALHTESANAQHYELPAAFFAACLGPHRKYSSCLYPSGRETLAEAESAALAASCAMAELRDGQRILELGCGWGSLTLFMAAAYPGASIVAVSNSQSQRAFIESQLAARELGNVRVVTADMNDFTPEGAFDRVVSVEMFEHMTNWRELLGRVRRWLTPEGRLFLHVFTHTGTPYRFDHEHGADWIAKYFFTGGIMPSQALIRQFGDIFEVEAERRWSGIHYERTALQWLANFDASREVIGGLLRETYGADAEIWRRRWRLFFLAVAGLFGHANGDVWGVGQYRLKPAEL